MPRLGFVALLLTAVTGSGPTVSATQAAVIPQRPTVAVEAFRVDPASGALTPLESAKVKKEISSRWEYYCYIEGAHSPVTIRQGEELLFARRLDGPPSQIEAARKVKDADYLLQVLFAAAKERRYLTRKYVPMEGGPYGEVVTGVNPKKPSHVGQSFQSKPRVQLPPGEYALIVGDVGFNGCTKVVSAFRIVEAPPPAAAPAASPPPPAAPAASPPPPVDVERLRQAAEQGDVAAELGLAWAYAAGNGVPQDYQRTGEWLRRAANQGSAEAQYNLAVMYRDAIALAPDAAQAALLFRQAAEQGHPQAQANLGNLHFFGRGVAADYLEAHKWLNIAASRLEGDERRQCVELRDKVAGLMTPAQLAEAQKRATDWADAFAKSKR